jgi:hypothetical protein
LIVDIRHGVAAFKDLKIDRFRTFAALIRLGFKRDLLPLIERSKARPLHRAHMHEDVQAAFFWCDEAVALFGVEELHDTVLPWSAISLWARRTWPEATLCAAAEAAASKAALFLTAFKSASWPKPAAEAAVVLSAATAEPAIAPAPTAKSTAITAAKSTAITAAKSTAVATTTETAAITAAEAATVAAESTIVATAEPTTITPEPAAVAATTTTTAETTIPHSKPFPTGITPNNNVD